MMVPTRNGKPTFLVINEVVLLRINEEVIETRDVIFEYNEGLELHFKKKLSESELSKIILPLRSNTIGINFSIDKKGRMIEARTNTKNSDLNDKLIRIFNSYPLEKLNITNNNTLNIYSYSLITRFDSKNIIRCNKEPIISTPPIFKECKNSKSPNEVRKCISEEVARLIRSEFNTNLQYKTNLKGKIRIASFFKVDKDGKIIDVKVKAPNPFLSNEVEKILKNMQPAISPGFQNGKAIIVPFSVPVIFNIM